MAVEKRKLVLKIWSMLSCSMPQPSKDPIDIVIPVIEKDLGILPLCLEGIRHQVTNKIKNIYVIAPDNNNIKAFCLRHNLEFVEEKSVLGIGPKDLNLLIETENGIKNRSGWLFQQLIKLSGKIGTCDSYVTIDADHILVQPHTFLDKRLRSVLYLSEEKNPPYRDMIRRLLPKSHISLNPFSYVAHKMIFNKHELTTLQHLIESENPGKTWIEAILANYDKTQMSGFSEFELYGNVLRNKKLRPWNQCELPYDKISDYLTLKEAYGRKYSSITFPEWKNAHN